MLILNRVDTEPSLYTELRSRVNGVIATNGKNDSYIGGVVNDLNIIFRGTDCRKLIVTENDKQFFGLRVYPRIDASMILTHLNHDIPEPNRSSALFPKYDLEIDSKLVDGMIPLLDDELAALILYFVYHVLYSVDTIATINREFIYNNTISISALQNNRSMQELITYGVKDAVMKSANPLYLLDGDLVKDDELLSLVNLSGEMYSALRNIVKNVPFLQSYMDGRFIALAWAIRVANDYEHLRGPAYKTLMKGSQLTGSRLESDMMTSLAKVIYTVNSLTESADPRYNMVPPNLNLINRDLKDYREKLFYVKAALNSPTLDGPTVMDCWAKANAAIDALQTYLGNTDANYDKARWSGEEMSVLYDRNAYEVNLNDWYSIRDRCKELKVKYLDRNDGKIPETFVNL